MLNKINFLLLISKIENGDSISDEDFDKIIQTLKIARLLDDGYVKDVNLTQTQNLLNVIKQNAVKYYEIYLGQ